MARLKKNEEEKKKTGSLNTFVPLVSRGGLAWKSLVLALVLGFQSSDSGPPSIWMGGGHIS